MRAMQTFVALVNWHQRKKPTVDIEVIRADNLARAGDIREGIIRLKEKVDGLKELIQFMENPIL